MAHLRSRLTGYACSGARTTAGGATPPILILCANQRAVRESRKNIKGLLQRRSRLEPAAYPYMYIDWSSTLSSS